MRLLPFQRTTTTNGQHPMFPSPEATFPQTLDAVQSMKASEFKKGYVCGRDGGVFGPWRVSSISEDDLVCFRYFSSIVIFNMSRWELA